MWAPQMSSVLLIDNSDPAIAILTLNRPDKRNALNIELIEAITRAINDTQKDLNRRAGEGAGAGDS